MLIAEPAAAGCGTVARATVLQLRPWSRETSNPSSVAAYHAFWPKAMSFTLAWNGTVDFVTAGAAELVADFEAEFFVPCADAFFKAAACRACVEVAFWLTWLTGTQELFEAS